jgi:sterol desaturase/sphingolipid hydroxylase (fatty acid hydroxylase superfamily)
VTLSVLDTAARPVDYVTKGEGRRAARELRLAVRARVYLPACGIVALAAAMVGVGWATGWGNYAFGGSVTSLRVVVIGPLAAAIMGVLLVVERVHPAQRRSLFARGCRQDVLYLALNVTLVLPLITALTLTFSELVRRWLPWIVLPHMGVVPRWAAIAAIMVAVDGCNWLAHLSNHRVRVLWRFHEVHHSQEDLNVLTVFRTHPFIHVSYLISLIPGIVLLANGTSTTILLVIYGGIVALAHSNTRMGFGPLGRIFVSPNFHRVHHQLDGPQDVNLGFALTIWDQLFGRAVFPTPEMVGAPTGLPGRPLRVENAGPRPRHISVLAAQLVGPFRPVGGRADQRTGPVRDRPAEEEEASLQSA